MGQVLKQATLLFLIDGDKILLAMKKRGFGKGHWNGVGGKPEPSEPIDDAAIRECQEEIGVTPLRMTCVAYLDFYFPEQKAAQGWDQQVVVYLCEHWDGTPIETEEMLPKWYKISKIPYDSMWSDDKYWLPKVLAGQSIHAEFHFDNYENVADYTIRPLA